MCRGEKEEPGNVLDFSYCQQIHGKTKHTISNQSHELILLFKARYISLLCTNNLGCCYNEDRRHTVDSFE